MNIYSIICSINILFFMWILRNYSHLQQIKTFCDTAEDEQMEILMNEMKEYNAQKENFLTPIPCSTTLLNIADNLNCTDETCAFLDMIDPYDIYDDVDGCNCNSEPELDNDYNHNQKPELTSSNVDTYQKKIINNITEYIQNNPINRICCQATSLLTRCACHFNYSITNKICNVGNYIANIFCAAEGPVKKILLYSVNYVSEFVCNIKENPISKIVCTIRQTLFKAAYIVAQPVGKYMAPRTFNARLVSAQPITYEKCLDIRHPCIGYECPIDMECHLYQPKDGGPPEPTCLLGQKRYNWYLARQNVVDSKIFL